MKRFLWLLLLVLIWPKVAASQLAGNATIVVFPGTPSGHCNSRQLALIDPNGNLYSCMGAAGTNNGTWQVVAGGGGGGGWNPPSNTPGNTLFGNNSVGTGSPSFFIPGGDVSFSAGNFSVNSLHFGPNALALTNTGIATGNCLQVSGSNIVGGACGTGGAGLPGLSSDGTTLTFAGSGGVTASQFTSTGTGGFLLTSAPAALPATPTGGQNGLVSGTNGWYVSNQGGAWTGPIGVGGGGGGGTTTNALTFNTSGGAAPGTTFNGSAAVTVSPSTIGAAGTASPTFTGTPQAPTPASTSNDTTVATTAFVKTAIAGGGGGGTPIPIALSSPAVCGYRNVTTGGNVTVSPVSIKTGDTVLVFVAVGASGSLTLSVTDDGGSNYTQIGNHFSSTFVSSPTVMLAATTAGGALASTTLTAAFGGTAKAVVCVLAYEGVTGLTSPTTTAGTNAAATISSLSITSSGDSNVLVALLAQGVSTGVPSLTSGSTVIMAQNTATNNPASAAICTNTGTSGQSVACSATFPSNPGGTSAVGVELIGGAVTPGASLYPKVVKVTPISFNPSAPYPTTTLCSTTDCPTPGIYRINHYVNITTACAGATMLPTIHWNDGTSAKSIDALTSPLSLSATTNVAAGQQLVIGSTAVIEFSIANVACSSGSGSALITFIVERLQ